MVVKVIPANKELCAPQIRKIFWEYLQWGNAKANEEFGVNLEIENILESDMQNLDRYLPPNGCLLLVNVGERPAGIACLKYLAPRIGEIKRMYVRPVYRKRGLGRLLLNRLLFEATQIGLVTSLTFSKDGKHLISGSDDGTVQEHTLSIDELMSLARSRLTRTWKVEECQKYLHQDTCPPQP